MNTAAVKQSIGELIEKREFRALRDRLTELVPADIGELVKELDIRDKAVIFRVLPRELATQVFEYLDRTQQTDLMAALGDSRVAIILNSMSPDDRTALLEESPPTLTRALVGLLSKDERMVALSLLGYPEHSVGRLMTPDYIEVRKDWTVQQVLDYVRANGKDSDTLNVLYVVDEDGRLIDDLRIREVLLAAPELRVADIMTENFLSLKVNDDQEVAVEMFKKYDRTALPVLDPSGVMLGILTIDDVLDVAEEEATEDIQKLGAVEVLSEPYIDISIKKLVQKRATWLTVLFLGELLTASAMSHFEDELKNLLVLAIFIPLIISSGGNSGSQAATLIIRAMAIGEISLKDWKRVLWRELVAGLSLGLILGVLGFLKIGLWAFFGHAYGPDWPQFGLVVGSALLAVVLWGAVTGSMLPFVLRRLNIDPATSSAPFVATIVDVTGLVIYFSIASLIML